MPSSSFESIWYVYGIVPAGLPLTGLPRGLDGAEVLLERQDGVAALVSILDGAQYGSAVLEATSGDVEWISPRAVAHDLVLTWASDHGAGAVVPLPMFSLFSGRDAVQTMLRDRASQLTLALARIGQGREYALRVYRIDIELFGAITSLSPRLREMANDATVASPGQRYLLERKLEAEKKTAVRAMTVEIVDEMIMELGSHAVLHIRLPVPRIADPDSATRGTLVLHAAFLIAPAGLPAFQRTLTSLVGRHGVHGFRFDFTGPWPPYHFVSDAGRVE